MLRKMKYTIILLLFSCLLFFGCAKKYPQDDVKYFALEETPRERINTKWLVTKYSVNNADATANLHNQYGNIVLAMNCSSNSGEYSIDISGSMGGGSVANFSFTQKNTSLLIIYVDPSSYPNLFIEKNSIWTILELTNIHLKLSSVINGVTYEIDCLQQP